MQPYLYSSQEFEVRFALVQLLNYYVNKNYFYLVLKTVEQIQCNYYYVNMAQAWAVSICYREFPEETIPFLKENSLKNFIHNKAIQKITESMKVSKKEKEYIRTLKRI